MKNSLTLIIGLPRSGKSTWIEKNKGDAIVVSNDWIRENILGGSYSSSANAIVWSIVDATLRILLSQNKNVMLDGLNHTPEVRKYFIDIAKKYGAIVNGICITTPLGICLKRNNEKGTNKLPQDKLLKIGNEMIYPQKGIEGIEDFNNIKYVDCWSEEECQ